MSHNHAIKDDDLRFIIDPLTRTIESQSDNRYLTQLDHESSRLTFEIPLTIEGHDMSKCDRIEIHFTNITKKKDEQNDGVYIVKDSDREVVGDTLMFSWLVRKESTLHVGRLNFSITFLCHDEDANVTYEWSTTESKYIQILTRLEHTAATILKYPDLYEQLKKELAEEYKLDESEVNELIRKYIADNPIETVTSWDDLEDKPFGENKTGEIQRLDEKYIPDTIARKSDLENITVETATDEEVLDMLLGLDTITTVADESGYILTDENNNILLW